MGVAVRTWPHSYRARLRNDLSCAAGAQIFHHRDPDIYLSGLSHIFRLRGERQIGIAGAVPRTRPDPSFECWDHPRVEIAQDFRGPGKALPFSDGHEVTKVAQRICSLAAG